MESLSHLDNAHCRLHGLGFCSLTLEAVVPFLSSSTPAQYSTLATLVPNSVCHQVNQTDLQSSAQHDNLCLETIAVVPQDF